MTTKQLMHGSALGVLSVALLAAVPAHAGGTAPGEDIVNTVTVSYEVNGEGQDDETATDTVLVDRLIDLQVTRLDNTATQVVPGQDDPAVTFVVENLSNEALDFELSVAQVTTGNAAGISGNDSFDVVAPFTYYLDDGNGVFDGADTLITHLDALAPDTPTTVHVVATDTPTGLSTGDIAAVVLTATARENDAAATLGGGLTAATTNTANVDTIFGDAAGDTDAARDAAHSATDDYAVLAAALTAAKSSKVVASPITGDTSGTYIPGATVEYCIAISNAAGGAAATNITISDDLSLVPEVTFDNTFTPKVGGADCDTLGANDGAYNGTTEVVSGTIASLAAGTTQTLIFRVTID